MQLPSGQSTHGVPMREHFWFLLEHIIHLLANKITARYHLIHELIKPCLSIVSMQSSLFRR